MSNKKLEKKIDAIIAEQGWLWGSIFITGGGGITFISRSNTISDIFWGTVGIILSILLTNAFFIRRKELIETINKLEYKE